MTTKRSTLLVTAAAAASAAGLLSGLDTGHGQAPAARTLTVTLADVQTSHLDGGRRGESAGDRIVLAARLVEAGRTTGRMVAGIDAARRAGRGALLLGTLDLGARGAIAVQGPLDFGRSRQGTLAITGGTGEFEAAAGAVDVVETRADRIVLMARLR
jgi:hypothetical protein